MESTFAIQGKDFAILVEETTVMHSIFKLKEQQDKSIALDKHLLISLNGDLADQREFSLLLKAELQLQKFETRKTLSVSETASYIREKLAYQLRRGAFQVNSLLLGFDEQGPQLYWMDYMGTFAQVPYGAHGYASYFVSSVIANSYHKELLLAEAIAIAKQCVFELRKRLAIPQDHFQIKLLSKEGISILSV